MNLALNTILGKCTKNPAPYRISGSDVTLFLKSPLSLYCKYFVDYSEMDPRDYTQDLFTKYGHDHENRLLEERYPGNKRHAYKKRNKTTKHRRRGREKNYQDPSRLDKIRIRNLQKTLQHMCNGTENLLEPQICFLPWGMHGSPDILERREGTSNFGEHYYIVKEIKSSKKIKQKHIMQAAFYNMMLGEMQGRIPDEFYLLNGAGEDTTYSYESYRETLADVLTKIIKIKNGFVPPAIYGHGIFPWSNYCDKVAVNNDDLSLIGRMEGNTRQVLEQNGINTVSKLLNFNRLKTAKQKIKSEMMDRHVTKAAALKTNNAISLKNAIPISATKNTIFLRLEEGLNGEPYMLGMLVRNEKTQRFVPFISAGSGHDKEMLSEFLRHLKDIDDFEIYYWGNEGETPVTRLMQKYPDMAVDIPMNNLQKLMNDTVVFPTYRDRLKLIAEWIGFEWADSEAEWGKGVLMYTRYIRDVTRQDCLEYVLAYGQDNCTAMATIWDWLVAHGCLRRI